MMSSPVNQAGFGRFSIVISTHAASFEAVAFKGEFESNLAKIARWGYQGVELAIRDPALINVESLQRTLANQGLHVPAIGTGQAWGEEGISFTSRDAAVRRTAVERVKRHVELAQRLDALVIIGLIRGVTPAGQSHEQSLSYLVDCLQECAINCEVHGVRMALEPLNRYETDLVPTVRDGLALVHKLGSRAVGLLLDTFHMNIEEVDPGASIREAGEHILHFHVADSNRWYPGAGHLDFGDILRHLQATGYKGWISGEFMPLPEADQAAQRSLAYLQGVISDL